MKDRVALWFGIEPTVRERLPELARGRTVVVDWFASRCCTSVTIGDLVVRLAARPPDEGFVSVPPVEGVQIAVASQLVEVLQGARPSLRLDGPPWARRIGIGLERPEAWLDFLACRPGRHRPTSVGS